jgi:hypothetical protein
MQGVLACIDANGVSDCSDCLMGHSDVLLVLLSPAHSLSGSGRSTAGPSHSETFAAPERLMLSMPAFCSIKEPVLDASMLS